MGGTVGEKSPAKGMQPDRLGMRLGVRPIAASIAASERWRRRRDESHSSRQTGHGPQGLEHLVGQAALLLVLQLGQGHLGHASRSALPG